MSSSPRGARLPRPRAGLAVEVRGLHRGFATQPVLAGIDLEIRRGEFVALLGPSGCGKSTLSRALAGLDPLATGHCAVPEQRAVVFQRARLLPWKRVVENVGLGLHGSAREREQRALEALDEVGLSHRARAWPLTLSGGEAQRAALARALVREPELLLLDEPFGALDALTRMRMHALVAALWERHRPSVLLVTHDVDEALLLADRALVLSPTISAREDEPNAGGHRIGAELYIDLPRPRRRDHPRLSSLRAALLAHLGVDDDALARKDASAPPGTALADRAAASALDSAPERRAPTQLTEAVRSSRA